MKYTLQQAQKQLPTRKIDDNKTAGGKCLVFAGSKGVWGAAILCATAAARCGAGYVHLHTSKKTFPILKNPDFLNLDRITKKQLSKFNAVAVGPGLISKSENQKWIQFLIKNNFKSVVIDAGALNSISNQNLQIPSTWILTPHEGELSRMIGIPAKKIRQHRKKYLKVAQKKFKCVILLKGYHTLVSDSDRLTAITTGNAALAKAGTGDVLTGMIAAFLSQGLDSFSSACLAAFVHGYMADEWIKEDNDIISLLATDLLHRIPHALNAVRKK